MDDKDAINKQRTSDVEAADDEVDITGNVRKKGEDPSPDDRERGERSEADPPAAGAAGGARSA